MPKKSSFLFAFLAAGLSACSSSVVGKAPSQLKAPFLNGRFNNLEPFPDKSFSDLMKWRFGGERATWPKWIETPQFKVPELRSQKLRWSVVNHATVLIQIDGLNILTDPIFSERASPVSFAGPSRVRSPGIAFADLPPIDVVMVSHDHYEHLDLPTLVLLHKRDKPVFLVGLGNRQLLESEGIDRVIEMDWWDEFPIAVGAETPAQVKVQFVPAQHWSARGLWDRRRTLWGGFYIQASKKVYFAGDTGYGSFLKLIRETIGEPDVAFLPIGAYAPRWFMKNAHMDPSDAVQGYLDLNAKKAVGIHFGTFQLTDEALEEPPQKLAEALQAKMISSDRFVVPEFGRVIQED